MQKNLQHSKQDKQKNEGRRPLSNQFFLAASILVSAMLVAVAIVYVGVSQSVENVMSDDVVTVSAQQETALREAVAPAVGMNLSVRWGDLGRRLVEVGAIDEEALRGLYQKQGGLAEADAAMLTDREHGDVRITRGNASYLLNLLWAFGLANKNSILEGEMQDPMYGGADQFASTCGWTLAQGSAMDHYNRHTLVPLDADQQALVEKVSRAVYRPCCDNETHFPDCNHGMAMLGLLELKAAQGAGEEEMWQAALTVNRYWFTNEYVTIAAYLDSQGIDWQSRAPKDLLAKNFASATGYARVAAQVSVSGAESGGSCGAS